MNEAWVAGDRRSQQRDHEDEFHSGTSTTHFTGTVVTEREWLGAHARPRHLFYEDELQPEDVAEALDDVEPFLDKLESLVGA